MRKKELLQNLNDKNVSLLLQGQKEGKWKLRAYRFDGYGDRHNHSTKFDECKAAERSFMLQDISFFQKNPLTAKFVLGLLGRVYSYPKYDQKKRELSLISAAS